MLGGGVIWTSAVVSRVVHSVVPFRAFSASSRPSPSTAYTSEAPSRSPSPIAFTAAKSAKDRRHSARPVAPSTMRTTPSSVATTYSIAGSPSAWPPVAQVTDPLGSGPRHSISPPGPSSATPPRLGATASSVSPSASKSVATGWAHVSSPNSWRQASSPSVPNANTVPATSTTTTSGLESPARSATTGLLYPYRERSHRPSISPSVDRISNTFSFVGARTSGSPSASWSATTGSPTEWIVQAGGGTR